MTAQEFFHLLGSMSYKPGHKANLDLASARADHILIRLSAVNPCSVARNGGLVQVHMAVPVFINEIESMDHAIAKGWIRNMWRKFEEHETDEWLMFGDERTFDPHKNDPVFLNQKGDRNASKQSK